MLSYRACIVAFSHFFNRDYDRSVEDDPRENCDAKINFLKSNREFFANVSTMLLASYRPYSYGRNTFRQILLDYINSINPRIEGAIIGNYFQTNVECNFIYAREGLRACMNEKYADYVGSLDQIRGEVFYRGDKEHYQFLDIATMFCPTLHFCPYEAEGVPYLLDKDHLTFTFTLHLLRTIWSNYPNDFVALNIRDAKEEAEARPDR